MFNWQSQFFFKPDSQILKRHISTSNGRDDPYHGFIARQQNIPTSLYKQFRQVECRSLVAVHESMV